MRRELLGGTWARGPASGSGEQPSAERAAGYEQSRAAKECRGWGGGWGGGGAQEHWRGASGGARAQRWRAPAVAPRLQRLHTLLRDAPHPAVVLLLVGRVQLQGPAGGVQGLSPAPPPLAGYGHTPQAPPSPSSSRMPPWQLGVLKPHLRGLRVGWAGAVWVCEERLDGGEDAAAAAGAGARGRIRQRLPMLLLAWASQLPAGQSSRPHHAPPGSRHAHASFPSTR